jgi:cytochrome b561
MKTWLIFVAVLVLYVHLFNAIAHQYFESDRTLSLRDIWRRFVPSGKIVIEL